MDHLMETNMIARHNAAWAVALNWRIRRRLPRITRLAIAMGIIREVTQ